MLGFVMSPSETGPPSSQVKIGVIHLAEDTYGLTAYLNVNSGREPWAKGHTIDTANKQSTSTYDSPVV